MNFKLFLIMVFLILINAALSGWNFHLYLTNGEPIKMVCGFVSAALAILITIQLSKKL